MLPKDLPDRRSSMRLLPELHSLTIVVCMHKTAMLIKTTYKKSINDCEDQDGWIGKTQGAALIVNARRFISKALFKRPVSHKPN